MERPQQLNTPFGQSVIHSNYVSFITLIINTLQYTRSKTSVITHIVYLNGQRYNI